MIDPKGTSKLPTKELNVPNGEGTSQNSDLKNGDHEASSSNSKKQGKKKADEVENDTVRHPYNHRLVIDLQSTFFYTRPTSKTVVQRKSKIQKRRLR